MPVAARPFRTAVVQSPALRRAARCLLGCALAALVPHLSGEEPRIRGACR